MAQDAVSRPELVTGSQCSEALDGDAQENEDRLQCFQETLWFNITQLVCYSAFLFGK